MIGVFRHGIDESAGYLEGLLEASGRPFHIYNLWEDGEIPSGELSRLLILGGKMSVNDEREYPFLEEEKRVIREMVTRSDPVLGICLGAQMIASALGARVYPGEKEVGWSPVTWIEPLPGIPRETTVFQWHGETFDLPDGASLVCQGDRVKNQAFFWKSALGVQFHIEVTEEMIRKWTADRDDRGSIARDTSRYIQGSRQLCSRIAEAFIRGTSISAR
jgi:GMP synthase-like glutamine amidotransferase